MDRSQLEALFTDVLDLPPDVDWSTVRYQETERWDSLAHMAIVAELEDRLGIMLDTDDVIDLSSFEKAIEILGKYDVSVD
jgi:acyl carrier protein